MTPFEQMNAFNRSFGDPTATYQRMQKWHTLNKPTNGVFCPSQTLFHLSPKLGKQASIAFANKTNFGLQSQAVADLTKNQFGLHLFGTWRNSLGIYRIDDDILSQLALSNVPNETPSNIFARLPEWCVYIEFPEKISVSSNTDADKRAEFLGFWALLDTKITSTTSAKGELVLHLVPHMHFNSSTDINLMPMQMAISDNMTVEQAIKHINNIDDNIVSALSGDEGDEDRKDSTALLMAMLPILLWLCAEEPDVSNINGEPISGDQLRLPKYTVNKKNGIFIPPTEPIIYDIGKRLGGEIRDFKDRVNGSDSRLSSKKRPHIRKGHWHGVWRGTGQNKHFNLYWQPAIFVNGN